MSFTGQGPMQSAQSDAALVKFIAEQVMNGMATAALVEIMAVNERTVDVKPMVDQTDGAKLAIPHGTIHAMPWFSLRAGAAEIRATPVVGDIGIAVFCHSDTSSVKATKASAPPPTSRRFDWSDGFYFGGFLGPTATTWIEVEDGQVEVKATTIKLTGNVQVTGSLTASGEVTGNGKALSTHRHGSVATGSGTSGPPT